MFLRCDSPMADMYGLSGKATLSGFQWISARSHPTTRAGPTRVHDVREDIAGTGRPSGLRMDSWTRSGPRDKRCSAPRGLQ